MTRIDIDYDEAKSSYDLRVETPAGNAHTPGIPFPILVQALVKLDSEVYCGLENKARIGSPTQTIPSFERNALYDLTNLLDAHYNTMKGAQSKIVNMKTTLRDLLNE